MVSGGLVVLVECQGANPVTVTLVVGGKWGGWWFGGSMALVIGGLVILAPGGSVTLVTCDPGGLGVCDLGGWWLK